LALRFECRVNLVATPLSTPYNADLSSHSGNTTSDSFGNVNTLRTTPESPITEVILPNIPGSFEYSDRTVMLYAREF
jgi:hypothetical protein